MIDGELIQRVFKKENNTICVLGMPGTGKSTFVKALLNESKNLGFDPPFETISIVDKIKCDINTQKELLNFYEFIVRERFCRLIFDGWPYEKDAIIAFKECDLVVLMCLPLWMHQSRLKARGKVYLDTSEIEHFYNVELPKLRSIHQDRKLLLVEGINFSFNLINDFGEWLTNSKAPGQEYEKQLLDELRTKEYQYFSLPYGGAIDGSTNTEEIIRKAITYLPIDRIRKAVDVGCEFGKACFMLAESGVPQVIGLDHDQRVIEIARKLKNLFQSNADFLHMKGEFYNFSDVDLVVCLSVSHHLPEPRYLYAQIMRAKWLVVELPHHKFSILEEAAQKLDRMCVCSWQSPKRDREVRIYCAPEEIKIGIPNQYQEICRMAFISPFSEIIGADYDGDQMKYDFIGQDYHEQEKYLFKKYYPVTHTLFVAASCNLTEYKYLESVEIHIEYDSPRATPVWLQIDWHFKNGEVEMVGQSVKFKGKHTFKMEGYKPLRYYKENIIKAVIIVRPDPGESISIEKINVTCLGHK
jgi:SAM-dependent methyltransferase/adenylate kinase family enzyme